MDIIWPKHNENKQCWRLSKEQEIKAPTPVSIMLSLFLPHNNNRGYFRAVSFRASAGPDQASKYIYSIHIWQTLLFKARESAFRVLILAIYVFPENQTHDLGIAVRWTVWATATFIIYLFIIHP